MTQPRAPSFGRPLSSIESNSKLVATLNNTTIGSYEKHISTNINYLKQLRKACQESCNYDDPDMNAQIKGMMKTSRKKIFLRKSKKSRRRSCF